MTLSTVAAERRKNVARAQPGVRVRVEPSPGGAKATAHIFRPFGAERLPPKRTPGLRPGLRSYAAPRRKHR